jgi:hypothetical protein
MKISGVEVARKMELSPSAVSKLAKSDRKKGPFLLKIADDIFEIKS